MEKVFYVANILDGLDSVFITILIISIIASVLLTGGAIATAAEYDEYKAKGKIIEEDLISHNSLKKWAKRLWFVVLISALCLIFIPDKKTYLLMMGGKVVDEAMMENPEIGNLPQNTLILLNEYIKTETEKMKTK